MNRRHRALCVGIVFALCLLYVGWLIGHGCVEVCHG